MDHNDFQISQYPPKLHVDMTLHYYFKQSLVSSLKSSIDWVQVCVQAGQIDRSSSPKFLNKLQRLYASPDVYPADEACVIIWCDSLIAWRRRVVQKCYCVSQMNW